MVFPFLSVRSDASFLVKGQQVGNFVRKYEEKQLWLQISINAYKVRFIGHQPIITQFTLSIARYLDVALVVSKPFFDK